MIVIVQTELDLINQNIEITVVTVVYKDFNGLRKSRHSLEEQNFGNWFHVIIDGDHDTDTKEFLETLPAINTVWISEPDKGIYDAMNKALQFTLPQSYVYFLNAGDVFANKDSLVKAAEALWKSNQPLWGCATHEEIGLSGEGWICKLVSKPSVRNQLYATGYRSHQGVLMRHSLIKDLGGFDENYKVAADWNLIVKAIQFCEPATWNTPIARFETGGFSSQQILLAHQELHQIRKVYLLKNPQDHIYDYFWRSIFLYPIGYRTLLGKLISPSFGSRIRGREKLVLKMYRRFILKDHSSLVRKVPFRLRKGVLQFLFGCLQFLYRFHVPSLRYGSFNLWRKFMSKKLKLEDIGPA